MLSELRLVCILRGLDVLSIHTCTEDFVPSVDGYLYWKVQMLLNTFLVFFDSLLVEIVSSARR